MVRERAEGRSSSPDGLGATPAVHVGVRTRVAARYPALGKAMPAAGGAAGSPTIHDAATAAVDHKDPGRPVDPSVATPVGAHLGADFSDVRVHQDALAQEATAAMGARAFAYGGDVFLGAGESGGDLALMAHELTHVVQQGAAGRRAPQRQVQVGDAGSPAEHEADHVAASVSAGNAQPAVLIVDDLPVAAGQMLKSQFLDQLRAQVTAATNEELGAVYAAVGCPYIDRYFGRYASEPASAGIALLHHFAPATRGARTAADMIPVVVARVREGVRMWRDTGQPPPEIAAAEPAATGAGASPQQAQALRTPDGRETLGSLEAELGPGTPLDGATAHRMSGALDSDVSFARIHTGPVAARKAAEADAVAFTVGPHVVLGARAPAAGSVDGDALLAHELSHTIQQRDAAAAPLARTAPIGGEDVAAEQHADIAAAGALARTRGDKAGLARLAAKLGGPFKTGLQLQRCNPSQQARAPAVTPVDNAITDGPYAWHSRFDVTTSDTEISVVIKPRLVPDTGITPDQIRDVKTRARTEFTRIFDNQFVLTDTANHHAYNLRCDVQFVDSGEHYQIHLHPGRGTTSDPEQWYLNDYDTDYAHELGHKLGLKDEYVDARAPDRASATAPGVHTDHSIMGDYYTEGRPAAQVQVRHGEVVANQVGGATGRSFTVARRP